MNELIRLIILSKYLIDIYKSVLLQHKPLKSWVLNKGFKLMESEFDLK